MCNEIKKVQNNKMCKKQQDVQKTIRCTKDNKMCKKDVQKTTRCAKNNKMCKKQQDVQKTTRCAKNNKMYKKRKTVYWGLINSNVNKRDVQTGCSGYCT